MCNVSRDTRICCASHVSQGIDLGERDASDDDAPLCAAVAAAGDDDDDVFADVVPEWLQGGMRTPVKVTIICKQQPLAL